MPLFLTENMFSWAGIATTIQEAEYTTPDPNKFCANTLITKHEGGQRAARSLTALSIHTQLAWRDRRGGSKVVATVVSATSERLHVPHGDESHTMLHGP